MSASEVFYPSSPGNPVPGVPRQRAVPTSPGNPVPGSRRATAVPKSPGNPVPGAAQPKVVPKSPGNPPGWMLDVHHGHTRHAGEEHRRAA